MSFYHEYSWNDLLASTHLGIIYKGPLTKNVNFIYLFFWPGEIVGR